MKSKNYRRKLGGFLLTNPFGATFYGVTVASWLLNRCANASKIGIIFMAHTDLQAQGQSVFLHRYTHGTPAQ